MSDKPGTSIETRLLALMTQPEHLAKVVDLKLRREVFEEPINGHAFGWMIRYWDDSGQTAAPTRKVMVTEFPSIKLPEVIEESTEWLVDSLKQRWARNRLQDVIRESVLESDEDPLGALDKLIKDATAVYERLGSPEQPPYDDTLVTKYQTEMHSRQEAKRRFEETTSETEASSWEPVDLGPYLRGEIEVPAPSLGVARSDGQRLLYPGLDHAVVADTGAGKTWFADACVLAEIQAGNAVVYVHYEEADPASTVERLRLLGAEADEVEKLLTFVGPSTAVLDEHLQRLLEVAPTLVIHDGMNEAMVMHGGATKDVEGAALFRQRLLVPFLRINAATLTCDHFPMSHDGSRVEAYGTVHKGNAMAGPRFALENVEPFGRGMRGRSNLFLTKDRHGSLWRHGRPTKIANKRFLASMVIDASEIVGQPHFEFALHAPSGDETVGQEEPQRPAGGNRTGLLKEAIYAVVANQKDHQVESQNILLAHLREAIPAGFTNSDARDALNDLLIERPARLVVLPGKNRAKGYRAVVSAS